MKKLLLPLLITLLSPIAFAKTGAVCYVLPVYTVYDCQHKDFLTGKGTTINDIYAKGWRVVASYVGPNAKNQNVPILVIEKD